MTTYTIEEDGRVRPKPKFTQIDCDTCGGSGGGVDPETRCRDCKGKGPFDDPDEVEAYEAGLEDRRE